ncbi:hypothetical protein LEL_06533 [Akanthomyces lecanii RCEF 1005]|uniref:Uncharacterized protein n=1 Tax=Akanthomyces lecanii RCEF 1005 TaxID=1081108 RepID=A0A168GS31_CORDF|nr:hypothetical protein LEL_06533 [Akanthomyces lecanii RCEF 1005]
MAQSRTRKRGRATARSQLRPESWRKEASFMRTASFSVQPSNFCASSRVQSVIKAAKQGRKGAIDAIERIRERGDEVLLVIEDERRRSNDGPNSRADGESAASLATEYALHSHDPIAGCETFEEAKRALQRFQSLAARFDAVTDQDLGPTEPRWMRWKQDVVDLTALNTKARKLSHQIIEGHLAPTGWLELTNPQRDGEDQELAQIAIEIVEEAVPRGAATWGTAAAQLIDVYGRVLKDTF